MRCFFIILCLFSLPAFCQIDFTNLNNAIDHSKQYDKGKEKLIVEIKRAGKNAAGVNLLENYGLLYEEYKVFNYDSAYTYAQKYLHLATQLRNNELVHSSKIKLSFILLSAGLFKEALDTLSIIPVATLQPRHKIEYFTLLARCYYDLADYAADKYHSPQYNNLGNQFLDSALQYPISRFDIAYYSGLKNIRSGEIEAARKYFEGLINDSLLTLHQQALATSTMSDIYIQKGQTDSAIQLLVKAAIADIKSSTKETSAIFNLSNLLFKKGDLQKASAYIEKAVEDALYYGARQRKVQMSAILPLIEGEKIARVENEKRTLITYAVTVTLLLLLLVYLTYIIAKQINKLKQTQKALTAAHAGQQVMNVKLEEANKIKEEYIGFFFTANTTLYNKIERFKKKAEQKIGDRKLEEIHYLLNSLNVKQERDELLKSFDTIFLKIFPHFIEDYNALFKKEDQAHLKDHEVLNTDLRIFALIRLGITDNDKIANILGYSVNTINSYKTKIKNRSLIPNEFFEEKIMAIKSV